MTLQNPNAEVFLPHGGNENEALGRATHLCIAAHQDDIEIMAYHAVAECFTDPNKAFCGVVVTDGRCSPREGEYADFTDEQMRNVRMEEQRQAARLGRYTAQFLLDYPSDAVKDGGEGLIGDLMRIITATKPLVLLTHNLFDKHDTHVAVALRVIEAVRRLEPRLRPQKVYGMECWRGLDWVLDENKFVFDTSPHPELAEALLRVFHSQIAGGKRYDLAALGRRTANATFLASHSTDAFTSAAYGLDLTALCLNAEADINAFVAKHIADLAEDVRKRVASFQ